MLRNVLKTLINRTECNFCFKSVDKNKLNTKSALGHYGATRDVGPVDSALLLTMTSMLANVIFVNV